jgi:hypothetical protein
MPARRDGKCGAGGRPEPLRAQTSRTGAAEASVGRFSTPAFRRESATEAWPICAARAAAFGATPMSDRLTGRREETGIRDFRHRAVARFVTRGPSFRDWSWNLGDSIFWSSRARGRAGWNWVARQRIDPHLPIHGLRDSFGTWVYQTYGVKQAQEWLGRGRSGEGRGRPRRGHPGRPRARRGEGLRGRPAAQRQRRCARKPPVALVGAPPPRALRCPDARTGSADARCGEAVVLPGTAGMRMVGGRRWRDAVTRARGTGRRRLSPEDARRRWKPSSKLPRNSSQREASRA